MPAKEGYVYMLIYTDSPFNYTILNLSLKKKKKKKCTKKSSRSAEHDSLMLKNNYKEALFRYLLDANLHHKLFQIFLVKKKLKEKIVQDETAM